MCLYVTGSYQSFPNTIAPKPAAAEAAALLHLPYSTVPDYGLAANAVPNNVYAVNGPHPSERVISKAETTLPAKPSRLELMHFDSTLAIGTGYSILPTESPDDFFVGDTETQSHMYTYATCENIGAAPCAGLMVGSPCTGTNRGQPYAAKGYCYKSHIGSLECGRLLDIRPRFGSAEITYPYEFLKGDKTNGIRCPAGTPLASTGKRTVRSLLHGGCMITTDAAFNPIAEVHVSELCSGTTKDLPAAKKGCMFPGALNYAPGAVQPTKCLYKVNGCTTAGALNYNSEASVNDGSCVMPVSGCTVPTAQYGSVASTTPGYKSLYVGKPLPNVGRVNFATYGAVKSTDSAANVLSGCTVIIEGCMDPTALNYDSKANSNTNTWCIPIVHGCMMPSPGLLISATAAQGARVHMKDGGATNYSAAATVHVASMCVVYREGCTDPTAVNYRSKASKDDGSCYYPRDGCLDKSALNFNCTREDVFTECANPSRKDVPTNHLAEICAYSVSPPRAPYPSIPPGGITVAVVTVTFTVTGTVEDISETDIDAIKTAVAAKVGCDKSHVTVVVSAASVKVKITVDTTAAGLSQITTSDKLAEEMGTADKATAFLAPAGVQVISTPVVEARDVPVVTPPAPPPAVDVGGLVGGIVGGIGGFLMLIGICAGVQKMKKNKSTTYPA